MDVALECLKRFPPDRLARPGGPTMSRFFPQSGGAYPMHHPRTCMRIDPVLPGLGWMAIFSAVSGGSLLR